MVPRHKHWLFILSIFQQRGWEVKLKNPETVPNWQHVVYSTQSVSHWQHGELSLHLCAHSVHGQSMWVCVVKHIETDAGCVCFLAILGGSPLSSVQSLQRHITRLRSFLHNKHKTKNTRRQAGSMTSDRLMSVQQIAGLVVETFLWATTARGQIHCNLTGPDNHQWV